MGDSEVMVFCLGWGARISSNEIASRAVIDGPDI
jgi:hypothetical protein